jgi:hypothetical protein
VGEKCPIILSKCRIPRYIQGSFTCRKATTWDRRLYFPSERRRDEDFFFCPKIPAASAGCEPANSGNKGQHDVGAIVIYFHVNCNVLKQINCALFGVIKDWISQNARYNCGKKNSCNCLLYQTCRYWSYNDETNANGETSRMWTLPNNNYTVV